MKEKRKGRGGRKGGRKEGKKGGRVEGNKEKRKGKEKKRKEISLKKKFIVFHSLVTSLSRID